jgi:hypothetical protein
LKSIFRPNSPHKKAKILPWGTVVTNLKLGAEKIFPLKIVDVFIEMAKTHKKSYFVFIFWFFWLINVLLFNFPKKRP